MGVCASLTGPIRAMSMLLADWLGDRGTIALQPAWILGG